MKIGIDARPLQNNNRFRGIGKYTESLLLALANKCRDDDVVFYLDRTLPMPIDVINKFSNYTVHYIGPHRVSGIKYIRAFALPYRHIRPKPDEIDLLLQTDPWGGIPKAVPTVAVFHDLIPYLFKIEDIVKLNGTAAIKNRLAKRVASHNYMAMLASYKNAAHIISVSQSSKNDYVRYLDSHPKNNISVILEAPIGGSNNIKKSYDIYNNLGLKGKRYILYVGGIDIRKNIVQLIHDLAEVHKKHADIKLVLVGKEFSLKNDLRRLGWQKTLRLYPGIEKYIIYAGYVNQEHLLPLYEKAIAYVTPTRYEGFGLQILEAFRSGCPVICYDNSSLPEVAGNGALLVPDGSPQHSAIMKIIEDNKLRKELIVKGKKQLRKFSWDRTAQEFMKVFASIKKK